MDPGATDSLRQDERLRAHGAVMIAALGVIEYKGNIARVKRAGTIIEHRRAPAIDIDVGRRGVQGCFSARLLEGAAAKRLGGDGAIDAEWCRPRIFVPVRRNDGCPD